MIYDVEIHFWLNKMYLYLFLLWKFELTLFRTELSLVFINDHEDVTNFANRQLELKISFFLVDKILPFNLLGGIIC